MAGIAELEETIAAAEDRYPALFQLLAGYFHQDSDQEFRSEDEALEAARRESDPTRVQQAAAEIDEVISLAFDEGGFEQLLSEGLGCEYRSPAHGDSSCDWLVRLRDRLAASPSASSS